MKFIETVLPGAYVVEPEPIRDERGFFTRTFAREEFTPRGLCGEFVQQNLSYNERAGTLRGMHFQNHPHAEVKLVSCVAGAIYDVIVDLRTASLTFGQWIGVELTAENIKALYIPKGFAHGYQTLADHTSVSYLVSEYYHPESQGGVAWDDPEFGIVWPPVEKRIISARDLAHPRLRNVKTEA